MEHNEFSSIKIGLASPEMIRDWSYGEVTKPETINYRTLKPEVGGLFCERIFGPTKDGACYCGKYKNTHLKESRKCEKCGVELTTKKVRRERMGHIELAAPVSHIWYFKTIPSRMAAVLELSPKQLEQVLYFAENVVLDAGSTPLTVGTVLSERQLAEYREMYENEFRVGMGAAAIKELLRNIGLEKDQIARRDELEAIEERTEEENAELEILYHAGIERISREIKSDLTTATGQKKTRLIKRLEVVEAFRKSRNKLEWMILVTIPVLPPDIRPMVQLDGGRFASNDLNELYRRVISRNNRLKKLLEIKTPEIVIRNEKRMLQEAVDALIDNGRRGKPVTGSSNRAFKSLSEMLRGKQGRFRQNLLGKRVDYSGRSVIVVGPQLKIYQCGLPREMALELFKPFVVKRLTEMGKATNVKDAQKKIERVHPDVWDALENVIKEHPVLLNRAPTLHRLSIQAFEPVLVDGRAIKLHPLVCTAFNADFDGDQMPVHVPLSAEAQVEARFLMLSANNLLKPMDGRAVATPTQDMILGSYYLTMDKPGEPGEGKSFRNFDEAVMAYENGIIGLHSRINVRIEKDFDGVKRTKVINTTLGRLIFNRPLPQDLGFVDRSIPENDFKLEIDFVVKKKQLGQIIDYCIKKHGSAICATMLDDIKSMGYKYSTRASFSISVYDMTIPSEKKGYLAEAQKSVDTISKHFMRGELSEEERYNSVVKLWGETTDKVTEALNASFSTYNPIKIMADSGARGSMTQMRQLAGMRGLMFSTSGKTMEIPIKSNFREGLNITEYFMGARSSRKSLSDTALRTADSGYLTRRLVDVAQEVIIREEKCDTTKGAWVNEILDGKNVLEPLTDRIVGRYTMGPVIHPETGEVIVEDDVMISDEMAAAIVKAGIDKVYIRTVIQCHAKYGICARCYGADLASGKPVNIGEAVGIIAAQSIGEPGTQLTMRTFHSGGVAGSDITQGLPRVEELFEARQPKKIAIMAEYAGTVHVQPGDVPGMNVLTIHADSSDQSFTTQDYKKIDVPYGIRLAVNDGDHVEKGDALTEGSKSPADIMRILGLDAVYEYVIKETQKVYRSQSCNVNDKHIEIIARQMTRKIRVEDNGDTEMLLGALVDIVEFEEENDKIKARIAAGEEDLKEAVGYPVILGISKAASHSESFLSAASFQETTKALTEAAIRGKVDHLLGLKENVIIGKLIPAGTGMGCYHNIDVSRKGEEQVDGEGNIVIEEAGADSAVETAI
ncbi:MAG: DNA-directed RNA polymerase subunit beta' [Clostridia bacterium]|nr:DNA-directed RNA polymerase subunit beta' [Clostridia bacterium]